MSTRVLTAVAWPYANGPRHIGHVSGFGVPSDVFSRYRRMVGRPGAHGQRHRRARHTDPGAGRRRGAHPPPARRQVQRRDHQGPAGPRAGLRPLHPHHHDQPLRGRAEPVPGAAQERLRRRQVGDGRDQPVHRAHAARPLRRGHLPDLRLRGGARRPVRQLRQPARPRRPHQPPLEDQRRDAAVRRDRALLPRPARVRRVARAVAVHPHRLAAQRAQVLGQPGRGPQAARDHPRPRLGRAHPARRLARPADEAALRVVRRGDRLPVGVGGVGAARPRPGRVEAVVVRSRPPRATTSWARTTSSSTR